MILVIKNILLYHIDDLIWTLRRLEKPLKEYLNLFHVASSRKKNWREWFSFREVILDPHLLRNLKKTEKFIGIEYESFLRCYEEYLCLSTQVDGYLQKMKSYPILGSLDLPDQNYYINALRLLKIFDLYSRSKKEGAMKSLEALKSLTSVDHLISIFNTYFRALKKQFIKASLEWKLLNYGESDFQEHLPRLKEKIEEYQQELQTLIQTMSDYRSFLLRSDTNPYVSSRWGFSEWIVGPEPAKAKKLVKMIYSANELNEAFHRFITSFTLSIEEQKKIFEKARQSINGLLHEMGQPLISRSMMHHRGERLLEQLKLCDEVGSPRMSMIDYVEEVLLKAMRQDWKYHVLHEFPLFHDLYGTHLELAKCFDDSIHNSRLKRFHDLCNQIKGWVEKKDVYSHTHEIHLDMNDMKVDLQDFLVTVQRVVKEKILDRSFDETIHPLKRQLLEYRYFFGGFFHFLMSKSADGIQLRNQFLFVDQYLESVEILFHRPLGI